MLAEHARLRKRRLAEKDEVEIIETDNNDEFYSENCFVCHRNFNNPNMLFIHLTVHKVDHTLWKAKNHKRSTMLKKDQGGVHCVGCTFSYVAEQCFVSHSGTEFVCTFCYDATRLDHCRKRGVRKDGTFKYEDFLLSEDMKQEVRLWIIYESKEKCVLY